MHGRLIVDPAALGHGDGEAFPPRSECAESERANPPVGSCASPTNRDVTRAAFDLAGRIYVVDLITGGTTDLPGSGRAIDPRIDPTGHRVAYVEAGALHVARADGGERRRAPEPGD